MEKAGSKKLLREAKYRLTKIFPFFVPPIIYIKFIIYSITYFSPCISRVRTRYYLS